MLNKAVQWIGTIMESFIKSLDVIAAYAIQLIFFHQTLDLLSVLGASCIVLGTILISAEEMLINKLPEHFLKTIL